jgi:hypothetical protein
MPASSISIHDRTTKTSIVDASLRDPMSAALRRGLVTHNRVLEHQANDPRTAPEAAARARRDMREADVLIRALENGTLAGGDLYSIDPELTRRSICTASVGLAPSGFPFAGIAPASVAQAAVLGELRGARQLDMTTAARLRIAAHAARTTPPDTLELLERTCR